jgi:hypothetical protein
MANLIEGHHRWRAVLLRPTGRASIRSQATSRSASNSTPACGIILDLRRIKMYDKHGFIHRIETTTNNVTFFRHLAWWNSATASES